MDFDRRPSTLTSEPWRRSLAQISTLFGRLAFLASLKSSVSARYENRELAAVLGPDEADRTLSYHHQLIFSQWIAATLDEQQRDLCEYLRTNGSWNQVLRYREFIPKAARNVERQLYLTDLEIVLDLLKAGRAAAYAMPVAS
jgi:hypothetical protein